VVKMLSVFWNVGTTAAPRLVRIHSGTVQIWWPRRWSVLNVVTVYEGRGGTCHWHFICNNRMTGPAASPLQLIKATGPTYFLSVRLSSCISFMLTLQCCTFTVWAVGRSVGRFYCSRELCSGLLKCVLRL